jgi:hypothetical protein
VESRAHPFWLSHEEKRHWLELSLEGRPRPMLELHDGPWGARREGMRRREQRRRGQASWLWGWRWGGRREHR